MKKLFLCIFFFSSLNGYGNLLIKIPTRQRPEQFFRYLDLYYSRLSRAVPFKFLISCDINDPSMNNNEVRWRFSEYINLHYYYDNNTSKISAYNARIDEYADWFDIVVLASDDMEPIVDNYDRIIAEAMIKHFPDYDGVLHFNDGNMGPQCNVMPIIGKKFYKRFGYGYSPAYKSFWCDEELTEVSRILSKEYYIDMVLMRHNHPVWGLGTTDNLYVHNETFFNTDKNIFLERRKHNFDITEADMHASNKTLWSILILSKPGKMGQYNNLITTLKSQIANLHRELDVQIISSDDEWAVKNFYENSLLRKATGKYISYLPCDCIIASDYVEKIYNSLLLDPDCVSVSGTCMENGRQYHFNQSIKNIESQKINNTFYSYVNLLNPIKRMLAFKCYFSHKSSSEHFTWEVGLKRNQLLNKEISVQGSLISLR